MKNTFLGVSIIILFMFPVLYVEAAGLNGNEEAIISSVRGKFQVDGVSYQAKESYVQELIGYLSQEGVDLTAEQSQEVIGTIHGSVKQGVIDGYLVKIEEGGDVTKTEPVPSKKPMEQVAEELMDPVIKKEKPEQKKDYSVSVNKEEGKVLVTNKENKTVLTVNTVIKDTGYQVNQTIILGVGMAMVMLLCTVVTVKSHFFAPGPNE